MTWAVIFTSTRTEEDEEGYQATAARMLELAAQQPGYLGVDLAPGITISYWESEQAIAAWKANLEHTAARQAGRERWYSGYRLRVAKVEREYGWEAE
jgi:heme-degrading monooxygenase HmoA